METLKRACSITDVDENTRAEVIEDFEHVRTLLQQRDALRESGYEVIRGQAIPRAERTSNENRIIMHTSNTICSGEVARHAVLQAFIKMMALSLSNFGGFSIEFGD